MIIYAGNLSGQTTDIDLKDAFGAFGYVSDAAIIMDLESGRSKKFGYIRMPDKTEMMSAIDSLNGKKINGKPLKVNALSHRLGKKKGSTYRLKNKKQI